MSSVNIAKPEFNSWIIGDPDRPETTVVHLITEGARLYLYGNSNKREYVGMAHIATDSGEHLMKLGGKLVAQTFDVDAGDTAQIVELAVTATDALPPVVGLRSVIAAKMVEGILETGQTQLAAALFDSSVTHPGVQEKIWKNLLEKDPDITMNF